MPDSEGNCSGSAPPPALAPSMAAAGAPGSGSPTPGTWFRFLMMMPVPHNGSPKLGRKGIFYRSTWNNLHGVTRHRDSAGRRLLNLDLSYSQIDAQKAGRLAETHDAWPGYWWRGGREACRGAGGVHSAGGVHGAHLDLKDNEIGAEGAGRLAEMQG
eukprot:319243-Rhodomonas_salina.1